MANVSDITEALGALKDVIDALPDTIKVDTTLTQSGKAADAKAVGDALVEKADASQLATKADASQATTVTVATSAWTGSAAPYTATVSTSLVTASNNIIVGCGGEMTEGQQTAVVEAMIVCTGQADGSITLSAFGEKPTVAIPVNILVVG